VCASLSSCPHLRPARGLLPPLSPQPARSVSRILWTRSSRCRRPSIDDGGGGGGGGSQPAPKPEISRAVGLTFGSRVNMFPRTNQSSKLDGRVPKSTNKICAKSFNASMCVYGFSRLRRTKLAPPFSHLGGALFAAAKKFLFLVHNLQAGATVWGQTLSPRPAPAAPIAHMAPVAPISLVVSRADMHQTTTRPQPPGSGTRRCPFHLLAATGQVAAALRG
jgi:hypothetical protein